MAKNLQPIVPSDQEADVLFKAQMKIADVVLGYWKQGLIAIGVFLLITLVVGLTTNYIRESKRDVSAQVARVDRELPRPDPLALYGLTPPDDLNNPERVEALRKAAEGYEAIGRASSGVAAAEAWIKAGDVWGRVKDTEREIQAFESAWKASQSGVVGYSAGNRLAILHLQAGEKEKAREILRKIATEQDGYLAEQALLDLMTQAAGEGDTTTVQKSAAEFRVRFPSSPRLDRVTLLESSGAQPTTGS